MDDLTEGGLNDATAHALAVSIVHDNCTPEYWVSSRQGKVFDLKRYLRDSLHQLCI